MCGIQQLLEILVHFDHEESMEKTPVLVEHWLDLADATLSLARDLVKGQWTISGCN